MAASLPGLEVTGERIPTPKNWSRDECSEIIVQDPADDNLYGTHDVETPYMVESWLKGMIKLTRVERTQTRTRTNTKISNFSDQHPSVELCLESVDRLFFRYILGFFCINPRSMLNRGTNTG